MSLWRREALARFPELHRKIADASGTSMLWLALWYDLFKPAYEKDPPDDETIARVYDYAYWSLAHRNWNVSTSAIISFFEKLPDDAQMRQDMPRWISQEDIDMLWFAWEYTTKQKFADFRKEFVENKTRIDKEKQKEKQRPAAKAGRH